MTKPTASSSLAEWLDWLLHLHTQEIELGLDRIKQVGVAMQVLKPAPFVITVAGTNGKGSSVAMLVSILKAAGYNVGSYTSPHLLRFNERIQVNASPVSDDQIIEAFHQVELKRADTKLTFFEFSTLAALWLFQRAQLDVVVLEVGLGGRLDAVNIVDADACLITAIDLDHCEWLGDNREKIGYEKAGIMRAGVLAVCSDPLPPQSLILHARQLKAPLLCLGVDFSYQKHQDDWSFNGSWQMEGLPIPALLGEFQLQNAAGVCALLSGQGFLNISQQAMAQGLKTVKHPGRLQCIQFNHQAWLFDVAHNRQSVQVLADYLSHQPRPSRWAIFSALQEKDQLAMVNAIKPFIDHWLIVDLNAPRATSLDKLERVLTLAEVDINRCHSFTSMQAAVEYMQQQPIEDVLVFGSFVTVSQAMEQLTWMK